MKSRKWLYTVLACVVIAGIAAGFLIGVNRGAPAVDVAAYAAEAPAPAPGKALAVLPDRTEGVPGMSLVAETAALALYYHPETTEIAVRDKPSGRIWYSNPADRAEDAIASPFEKEALSSQLTVTFRDSIGTLETYPNYTWSVTNGNFQAESIENGIRVTYTLGDVSLGIDALPKYITPERLQEKVLSKLDATLAKYVQARYYPMKDNPAVLERLDEQIKKELVLKKMLGAFEQAGYAADDLAIDNASGGGEAASADSKPRFTIPIEYRLDENSLMVSVPLGQVTESETYRLRSLELLRYFGAAGTKEQGYMLVPDGSGSLIMLNNGKVKEEQYVQRIYGTDPNHNSESRGQVAEPARMPVFGMKSGDGAWLAIIEEGDAVASVSADISGKQSSYNHVFSSFAVRGEDMLELYTGSTVQEIQLLSDKMYDGHLSVRYSFLSGGDATYSGMARLYQQRLVKENKLTPLAESDSLPFYLDMLGSVDKQRSFLGVPYHAVVSMTTFDQAGEIAGKLMKDGVSNLRMRYLGWFGKGVHHKPPVNAKTDGAVGSASELKELAAELQAAGGGLYPDVAFQHVYRDDGSFTPASDAARFVTRETAELHPYDRNMNRMDSYYGTYYLMSPAKLPHYVSRFADSYGRYGIASLSLRDLGDVLSSDYRVQRVVFRETAKLIAQDQLERLREASPDLMVSGGNAYSWPYAKHLIDVPAASSKFGLTDAEVPFYQMVIHGYIDYAAGAFNIGNEQNPRKQLLRSLEMGSAPRYLWSYEQSSELKYTRFDEMYAADYRDWYEEAVALYNELNEVLAPVRTERMVEHTQHADGVVEVKYESGMSILINYTDKPASVRGITVEPQSYAVGGDRA
ncbi:DUF5696 domain-containing protein [Paenibacillus lactis]|uniref:DUF5696 domain-containing protein n=1 Tax=Paenibacillus lactis TaxID=228574 RepID=UPI0011A3824D